MKKRSTILGALAAILCLALCSCFGTPDEVKRLHAETGADVKTVLEVYAKRVQAIQPAGEEEAAAKQRELLALENIAKRIVEGLDGVGEYLDAAGIFASDKEREEFFQLVRDIRGATGGGQ
jgi:hypothetical protein